MEERREMNEQRMMTREELEMRLPALNHIAEQRDAKFRLRYAEKTVNNGIERGYTLDAGTRVSVNVYQNESWAQMPDEELFDTLNDLDGKYCVTDRFIRAVRVHACDQVDTADLAGMRDMMKIAAAFGLYEIDPDDVLPAQQRK